MIGKYKLMIAQIERDRWIATACYDPAKGIIGFSGGEYRELAEQADAEVEALKAEVARLRQALARIADDTEECCWPDYASRALKGGGL